MAGDWIKVEVSLPTKPEVIRIGRALGLSPDAICGVLIRFWGWASANSVDGVVDGVETRDIDMVVSLPGFADALVNSGWLKIEVDRKCLILPNFTRHNGESSKKRALKASRQARWRDGKVDGVVDAHVDVDVAKTGLPEKRREEKRRDKSKNTSAAQAPFVLPDWISPDAWQGFEEMRGKAAKTRLTDRARASIVVELEKLKARGFQPDAVLDQSTRNSWSDVYPIKAKDAGRTGTPDYSETFARINAKEGD